MLFFLCEISDLDRLADLNLSCIRLEYTCDHLKNRRFSTAVRPDNSKPLISKHNITEIIQNLLLTKTLADMMKFNRLLSHPRLYRIKLHRLIRHRCFSCFQRFQTFQSCLLLCRSRTASTLRPFQFHPKDTLTLSLTCKLHLFPLCLQFKKSRIVRIITIHLSMTQLQDTVRHAIQEIAVMCYHKNSSTVRSQIIFQPGNHLLIQMVRRLVQKKYVKISCQDLRKNHTSLLPSGQSVDLLIPLRDPKFRQITLHLPALRICILKCIRTDIHPLRKCRILRNKSNLQAILTNNLPFIRHFFPCNHLQKS